MNESFIVIILLIILWGLFILAALSGLGTINSIEDFICTRGADKVLKQFLKGDYIPLQRWFTSKWSPVRHVSLYWKFDALKNTAIFNGLSETQAVLFLRTIAYVAPITKQDFLSMVHHTDKWSDIKLSKNAMHKLNEIAEQITYSRPCDKCPAISDLEMIAQK